MLVAPAAVVVEVHGAILRVGDVRKLFATTVLAEPLGSRQAVVRLRSLIVAPGLWILIPAIAANGVLRLLPCALLLDH